eukprot:gene26267-biopygen15398
MKKDVPQRVSRPNRECLGSGVKRTAPGQ